MNEEPKCLCSTIRDSGRDCPKHHADYLKNFPQEQTTPPSTGLTYTVVEFVNQRIDSELAKINELVDSIERGIASFKEATANEITTRDANVSNLRKRVDATEQRCAALERSNAKYGGVLSHPKTTA